MKCHYEVLQVARDAPPPDIKSSYRKLALRWHPDKNLGSAEAKERFQLVQQAYEVLGDPQERAWYDKHREQILHGASSGFEDASLDVFPFFSAGCFRGYGDDARGFYAVYRGVFDALAAEEMAFMEEKAEFCAVPGFGAAGSDYARVAAFYGHWGAFCTRRSYVWLDPYEAARDRRTAKLAERENRKVRLKARKERNEEVRRLVAFVRRRDRRVRANARAMEARGEENRRRHEAIRRQKREERQSQLLDESGAQAEWAKFDNVRGELREIEKSLAAAFGDDLSGDESDEGEDFYCVACNKVFKTVKSFENHESSRKHRDNVERLKRTMLDEEDETLDESEHEFDENLSSNEDLPEEEVVKDKKRQKDEENDDLHRNSSSDELLPEEEIDEVKKSKKNAKVVLDESDNLHLSTDEDLLEEVVEVKKEKKKKKKAKLVLTDEPVEINLLNGNESDDGFSFDSIKTKKKGNNKQKAKKIEPKINEVVDNGQIREENKLEEEVIASVKSKKKQNKNKDAQNGEIDTNHVCVTCKSSFLSKNKLFDHLKKTGHGVLLGKESKLKRK